MTTIRLPDEGDPRDVLNAAFWTEAHGLRAFEQGWRLVLFLKTAPRGIAIEKGGPVVLAWPARNLAGVAQARVGYDTLTRILARLDVDDFSLVSRDIPREVEDALAAVKDFRREIRGQVSGYWIAPGEDLPTHVPGYLPTGAVLPFPPDSRLPGSALALVEIDGLWYPLSVHASPVYVFGAGLARREPWRFVTYSEDGPNVFKAVLAEPCSANEAAIKVRDHLFSERLRHDALDATAPEAKRTLLRVHLSR